MLKRFYTAVVHRRRAVLAAFVLAAVLSVFASRAVQVDYDINDYLPPDSPSTIALEQMNSAFTGGIPNMRVMVRDVTVPEALDYKEKLAAIDGVEAVTWLDDSLDVTVPLQMQDTATVETYYKDNCALFTVTVDDAKRLEAVAAIQDLIGEDNALAGTAVSTAVATNSTVTEVAKIAAIAVVAVTLTAASMVIIPYVARFFVGYDPELLALTSRAFRLYALSFVIMGFNVYASSFFTALGDGVTSALISFLRTLVFQIAAVLILPAILGIDGIWLAVTAAELAALAVSAAMFVTKDKVFHYRKA